jgi:hypothetical protein
LVASLVQFWNGFSMNKVSGTINRRIGQSSSAKS